MSMTNREVAEHIDAFKYWCETNDENGVITLPKFLCEHIVEILDNNKEQPHGECRTCKHFVIGGVYGKEYVCEHPDMEKDDDYVYACITMEANDFCSRYEQKEGEAKSECGIEKE